MDRDVTIEGYEDGNFLGSTIFGDIEPEMEIVSEEIFSSMLGLMPVGDVDEAIKVMNRSDFGNAASLFTGSGADACKARQNADIGNLGIKMGTSG